MSAPDEAATRATEFTTDFYNVFTMHWQSTVPSSLTVWVTAVSPMGGTPLTIIPPASFRPTTYQQTLQGTDKSTGIGFQGTFTAAWHTVTNGKLTCENMLFTMADGTPYNLTGDIGLWS